jgi:hypothetical protein
MTPEIPESFWEGLDDCKHGRWRAQCGECGAPVGEEGELCFGCIMFNLETERSVQEALEREE